MSSCIQVSNQTKHLFNSWKENYEGRMGRKFTDNMALVELILEDEHYVKLASNNSKNKQGEK